MLARRLRRRLVWTGAVASALIVSAWLFSLAHALKMYGGSGWSFVLTSGKIRFCGSPVGTPISVTQFMKAQKAQVHREDAFNRDGRESAERMPDVSHPIGATKHEYGFS